MKCLWFREASPAADGTPQVRLSCSDSGSVAEGLLPLFSLVSSSFDERLPDQFIAGRKASCYSFDDPTLSVAVFCVDALQRIPLLISTEDLSDPRLKQELVAQSVSTAVQELGFPIRLQKDLAGWSAEATVPIGALQLPHFDE